MITKRLPPRATPEAFIRDNTHLAPVPTLPAIRLHMAHQASGLWRLAADSGDPDPPPPYWAFPWAGGLALARYIGDRPDVVYGRRVFDLGAGSGLVAIAAAMAGAADVVAADIDAYALAAIPLNAAANAVRVSIVAGDVTVGTPPAADVLMVGDLFYEPSLARRVGAFLDRCVASGIDVLVGDPNRRYLPRERLKPVAEYVVPDVGEVEARARNPAAVFAWRR